MNEELWNKDKSVGEDDPRGQQSRDVQPRESLSEASDAAVESALLAEPMPENEAVLSSEVVEIKYADNTVLETTAKVID